LLSTGAMRWNFSLYHVIHKNSVAHPFPTGTLGSFTDLKFEHEPHHLVLILRISGSLKLPPPLSVLLWNDVLFIVLS
jgi:hypothetical protein